MTGPVAPRWVVVCAHAVPLCVLPAGLWRIAMALGVPVGFSAEVLRDDYGVPGWGVLAIIGLSVFTEGLALLTIGLVRPWGEVFPAWMPILGGRTVNARVVTVIALTGAAILTVVCWSQLPVWIAGEDEGLPGAARTVMGLAYAPLLAWGPLLAVVAVAYLRRRRRPASGPADDPAARSSARERMGA